MRFRILIFIFVVVTCPAVFSADREPRAVSATTKPASALPSVVISPAKRTEAHGEQFRLEQIAVSGGAQLLTVFSVGPKSGDSSYGGIPLLSVLRDTLGDDDPDNDRLRNVWVLTSAHPTLLQRAAAAIPFFYFNPDLGKNADKRPTAVLDLANTRKNVWGSLASSLTQVLAIDSNGALIRSATRRYRTNLGDLRRVHLIEGLAVLAQLENIPEVQTILSQPELLELQARMTLAGQTLGGLVTAEKLPDAYFAQRRESDQTRGHNWDLLRQSAEANGLYFDPLGLGRSATHALIWIAREDLADNNLVKKDAEADATLPASQDWTRRFLDIANPYDDARLTHWDGYTQVRYYDADGRQVNDPVPGGDSRELIPLGLYSLDYPKVPLLLVDFRDSLAPKRREMISRATTEVLTGVLGVSRWGNWPYMGGSFAWNFVRSRHGTPTDRNARLEAYSQVRRWLALDHDMDPELRREIQKWLERLGVNPLEDNVFEEADIAGRQYAALMEYVGDPKGLAAQLERDRDREMRTYHHKPLTRVGLTVAKWASLGIYSHHEPEKGEALVAELDLRRRAGREVRFLESVSEEGWLAVASDVAPWRIEEIERSIDALAADGFPGRSAEAVERIFADSTDPVMRELYRKVLNRTNDRGSQLANAGE